MQEKPTTLSLDKNASNLFDLIVLDYETIRDNNQCYVVGKGCVYFEDGERKLLKTKAFFVKRRKSKNKRRKKHSYNNNKRY